RGLIEPAAVEHHNATHGIVHHLRVIARARSRDIDARPTPTVPLPRVAERWTSGARCARAAEQDGFSAPRIKRHRVETARRRTSRGDTRPMLAVEFPGVAQPFAARAAAEQHDAVAARVVDHDVRRARCRTGADDLAPLVADT